MNCIPQPEPAIERYVACFKRVGEAALAAGVSREQLRKMRRQGFVSTRERALIMAEACNRKVRPEDLMAFPKARAA